MDKARVKTILVWVGSAALALMFLMSGGGKLANAQYSGSDNRWDDQMEDWGYPGWFRFVVGIPEVLFGIGVLIPAVRPYAAAGLVVIMAGAVVTHIANGEAPFIAVPVVLGVVAFLIAWTTRPAWARRPTAGA